MSRKNVIRALAGTAGVLLVAGAAGPGAAAVTMEDSGDVQATVRKTLLQTATAEGEVLTSRMYTQVSAVGNGTKTVLVPVGSTSNRNLNEFGPFPMEGESIQFDLTVDGGAEERTLTDADISPMEVSVTVMLDGVEIQPEDVVGASGVLDVEYTVRNTTATTDSVTFADVEGTEITEDVETADPFVGSLDVTLPKGFNEVTAPGATIAGNGQNQTSLGYSFVLFPPLGAPEATVGYQARISDGVMPPADFAFLPIVPFDNSTIAGTAEAYKGGAAVGAQIFGAGKEIGDNLLKLQDGAGQLVAGLGQLSAGAVQISDGLVNTAVPGAEALAEGSAQVSDGLGELNSQVPALADGASDLDAGANLISDGLNQLDSQVPALADGAGQLDAGAQQLSGGLNQLNGQVPALVSGAQDLDDGAQQVAAGMAALDAGLGKLGAAVETLPADVKAKVEGSADYQKLIGGLDQIIAGLRYPGTTDCDVALTGGTPAACGAMDAVDLISGLLATGASDLNTKLVPLVQGLYFGAFGTAPCGAPPNVAPPGANPPTTYCDAVSSVYFALFAPAGAPGFPLGGLQPQAQTASDSLADVSAKVDAQVIPGLQQVKGGIPLLVDSILAGIQAEFKAALGAPSAGCDPTATLLCASAALKQGTADLADGTAALNASVPALAAGVDQLATGAGDLADGTEQLNAQVPTLAAGVSQLAAGGNDLADGTGELSSKVPALADGVQQLDEGAAQVADGNQTLSDGLGDAADGSKLLVDGLADAEPGGAQIEQGAGDLKEQGADELAKTGKEAQLGYAVDVAQLEAAQQAGLEGAGIPFGLATGTDTITTAAVQMQLAGIAPETDDDALKIGLGILLIVAAGGAAFFATRKASA